MQTLSQSDAHTFRVSVLMDVANMIVQTLHFLPTYMAREEHAIMHGLDVSLEIECGGKDSVRAGRLVAPERSRIKR